MTCGHKYKQSSHLERFKRFLFCNSFFTPLAVSQESSSFDLFEPVQANSSDRATWVMTGESAVSGVSKPF